jgi:anti-sigma-K factor RskA
MISEDKNSAGSGSYVLNAMDEKEREEFETQMAGSEELRNEVTELTDTAVLLGMAVTPVAPSPELKNSIMAKLSQTPQLGREEQLAPVRTLRAVPALVDDAPAATAPAKNLRETNAKAQQRWYTRPVVAITAAAAAVRLFVGGVVGTNVALQGASTSQQASALAAITSAADVQRAEGIVSTGGKATLVWSLSLKKSAIISKGLTVLPSGKTYELWYINQKGTTTPAGTFESNGKSTLQVLNGHLAKGDIVGVTVEPAGGSKAPTTKPIFAIASA